MTHVITLIIPASNAVVRSSTASVRGVVVLTSKEYATLRKKAEDVSAGHSVLTDEVYQEALIRIWRKTKNDPDFKLNENIMYHYCRYGRLDILEKQQKDMENEAENIGRYLQKQRNERNLDWGKLAFEDYEHISAVLNWREKYVLRLKLKGFKQKEIADKLNISEAGITKIVKKIKENVNF